MRRGLPASALFEKRSSTRDWKSCLVEGKLYVECAAATLRRCDPESMVSVVHKSGASGKFKWQLLPLAGALRR